jgi:hypothetical protein
MRFARPAVGGQALRHPPLILLAILLAAALGILLLSAVAGPIAGRRGRGWDWRRAWQVGPELPGTDGDGVAGATVEGDVPARRLDIVPLSREDAVRFGAVWRATQARFIDDPRRALVAADRLLGEVLYARGFPLGEIERHAAAIAIGYPRLVRSYRQAHGVALRHARGQTSTEDLRQALVAYRTLFEDLLDPRESTHLQPRRT